MSCGLGLRGLSCATEGGREICLYRLVSYLREYSARFRDMRSRMNAGREQERVALSGRIGAAGKIEDGIRTWVSQMGWLESQSK